MRKKVFEKYDNLFILVNNAGVREGTFSLVTKEEVYNNGCKYYFKTVIFILYSPSCNHLWFFTYMANTTICNNKDNIILFIQ